MFFTFAGVFDGHGVNGHGVSEFLMNRMPQFLLAQRNLEEETTDAFISSFAATSDALIKSPIDCTFSGSTGVCVLLNRRKIICGNVGDSRAVLASVDAKGKLKAIALSDDHKPDRPDEMKRILENRGRVEACQSPQGPVGPARVWLLNDDVPGLAMSRSFGDLIAASVGVTPEPEILEHDVRPCDKYIIMVHFSFSFPSLIRLVRLTDSCWLVVCRVRTVSGSSFPRKKQSIWS
jgi:serine/threonine protein phosphatase PrpC